MLAVIGYDDPDYGKDVCLVYGKVFWPEASPQFPTIARNAIVFIPLFTIWRVIFEKMIDGEANKYALGQQLKKGNNSSFETNRRKYKESYWKTITNSILLSIDY